MKRYFRRIFAFACLVGSLPLCASAAHALDAVTLQLKWTHAFQFAGYYAAKELGYYREAGLDVRIDEALPGTDPVNAVLDGKAEFGVGTSALLLQRKAGKPVIVLAVIFQHSAYALIARQQNAVQTIHDLVGKRLMLEPQADEILAYLKQEGILLNRVTQIEHSYDPQDLIDGKTDAIAAYVTNQPYFLDRAHFAYQIYTPRSAGIDFYGDNLFTTERELETHPARVKAFRAASLRGWQYAMENPGEIIDLILAKYSKRHPRDYYLFEAKQMIPLLRPELIEIGYMYPGRWRHMAETYADIGMLPRELSLDGFLYDPNPKLDLTWFYRILAAALLLTGMVGSVALFYVWRNNRGLARSLAERARAEDALRASEAKLRELVQEQKAILDSNVVGIVKLKDRNFIWINDAFSEMFGYTNEEVIGAATFAGYPSKEAYDEFAKSAYPALRRGEIFRTEIQLVCKDKTLRWYAINGAVLHPGSDESIWSFVDVTERRRADELLKSSEDKFKKAFYLNPEAVNINRLEDGMYVSINRGFTQIMGYTENEIIGHTSLEFNIWDNPEDRARLVQGLKKDGMVANLEARFRTRDGDIRHGLMSAATIEIENVPHIISITRDMTERRKAEEVRAQLEMRLRESQKIEALGTLAGGVAHDFNNILAAILGNVELARQDVGPSHAALASLEEIDKASRRAKDLVQQILTFGRRQKLERKATSLALVVVESARLLRATLPAMVNLSVDCKADTPAVLADATAINQILLNLCSNAFHAVQDQGRPGIIEIRLHAHTQAESSSGNLPPGRYACLTVRDNGSGMDEAVRAHMFEPFFTTKPKGKGTGLGLSVVHGIAKAHEACVKIDSTPGKGSEFQIYFPASEAQILESTAPERDVAPVEGGGKHVLYIDDEEAIIYLMTQLLERQGYRVSGYIHPKEALAAVRANPGQFDIAVTDYNMPGMSGLEVAQALKEVRADLPVLLASGYITEELRQMAPAAGVRELIYKPNTVDDLCKAVARFANAQ